MPNENINGRGRRMALFANAKSRRGEQWFEQAKQTLGDGGAELVDARLFKSVQSLAVAVELAVKDGIPLVAVGGGDGTFGQIAHLFARQPTILGVLPLGTGNAFARDLGIPPEAQGACDTILNGVVAEVDMGLIGDHEFVNIATIGLSTKIALGLQSSLKKKFGRFAYLISLAKALATVEPFRVILELPSGRHEFDSLQLVIGNGRFHAGPFPVTPDASITAGWLSIYALASTRKMDFLKMALYMSGGRHVNLPEVRAFRAQEGRLSAFPVQRVTVDGETKLRTPVTFGIVPGALKVMVSKSSS